MTPILRLFPLEALERFAEMMHDALLFIRMQITGKDQDPPFAGAWESARKMDYCRFTLAHDSV